MKLVIDAIPPSLNKLLRMHWATRGRLRQDWRVLVFDAAIEVDPEAVLFGIEIAPTEPKLVQLDFYFPDRRRRDADNYQKLALDSLVANGLLYDDSMDWCEVRVRGFVDKENPRTEITLETADLDALRIVGVEVEGE